MAEVKWQLCSPPWSLLTGHFQMRTGAQRSENKPLPESTGPGGGWVGERDNAFSSPCLRVDGMDSLGRKREAASPFYTPCMPPSWADLVITSLLWVPVLLGVMTWHTAFPTRTFRIPRMGVNMGHVLFTSVPNTQHPA